jgi:cytoskeletal protein RodZ
MTVPAVNIVIEKGTSFEATYNVTNADNSVYSLTNQSATAKIRKHPTATSSKSFTTTITTATGEVKISMGSTVTAELTAGRNYYDVILTHATTGKVTKIFEGMAMVNDTISV